jgi:hypothetical protein
MPSHITVFVFLVHTAPRFCHAGSGKHAAVSDLLPFLFYLNDDMEGGETLSSVVEYGNVRRSQSQTGKVEGHLFYNLLPDGNYDERLNMLRYQSRKETSYLTNLWIWDPIMDHTNN